MILLILFILAIVSGYRDLARFVIKGTWSRKIVWIPVWGKSGDRLDSFHAAGGLMWTIILGFLIMEGIWITLYGTLWIQLILFILGDTIWYLILTGILHLFLYWGYFYWIRNVFMHILFRSPGHREMEYLNPLRWFTDKLTKRRAK